MRSVAYCELEGFAQANLVSKMEAGLLDAAPIWSDLRTFPYAKFRGLVDIAAAGIPCQPHSHAGKRKGGADERFLFDEWLDGLEHMRPGYIFIENVEGLLSSKMPDGTLCIRWTVERLEGMGYRVAAGLFSAAEVGAWHERRRVFILAANTQGRRIQGGWADGQQGVVPLGFPSLPDALSSLPPPCLEGHAVRYAHECRDVDGDREILYCPECRTDYADCVCVGPSMDDDFDYQEDSAGQLTAHTKPDISGDYDGPAAWVDRMRLLGNGVVPAVATKAFITLWNQLHIKPSTTL
jgi:DNA (cytosine-5)-methyltransferase 1